MAADKNILYFSYYFPPIGMGGVGRPLALYKLLPQYGINVDLVTVKDIAFPHHDYSLLADVDLNNIHRTGSLDPARLFHKLGIQGGYGGHSGGRKMIRLYYPDMKRGWNCFAFREARKIMESKRIDAVITSSPPPSTHLFGRELKRRYNIPWLADFRDFWLSFPIEMIYPDGIQSNYAHNLKRKILAQADCIVAVNSSIQKYLGRGEIITNGADLNLAPFWQMAAPNKNKCTIGILGTINYLCPIDTLFRAVAELISRRAILAENIRIIHVGHSDRNEIESLIKKYSLENIMELKGYLPKSRAISELSQVDILYFSVAEFGQYHILPGRIFDYLISGKPIVASVPCGSDAEKLLNDYGSGFVCNPDNIDTLSEKLLDLYQKKMKEGTLAGNNAADAHKYSTAFMAEKFAGLIKRVVDGRK